jgi:hypothetical protein
MNGDAGGTFGVLSINVPAAARQPGEEEYVEQQQKQHKKMKKLI